MNGPRETRPESDAPTGALALHRDMRNQALKVPWRELASACDQLAQWRLFGLWVRAIVDAEHALPEWLAAAIEGRCPAFLQSRREGAHLPSLWLDLNEWVDFHFFSEAIQEGWIQALHYYYGRQPAAELIWQHWTRMDEEWRLRKPVAYPTFDHWQEQVGALHSPPTPSQYVEWEAFALWTRSLIEAVHEIPAVVRSAVEARCPGFEGYVKTLRDKPCSDPAWLWDQLRGWIERHFFAEAIQDASIEGLRAAAHRTLRSERIIDYWASQGVAAGSQLPTYEQWLAEADAFVVR